MLTQDPIVIINGFTKNWRLPGWRCCWVVGPKHCIEVLGSIGSFMDGGANNPLQKAALPFLQPDFVKADALALQAHFRAKRDYMVAELAKLGIKARRPESTFYIWADVSGLPPPLNNGVIFFEYCIRHKVSALFKPRPRYVSSHPFHNLPRVWARMQVICVPGIFFDVNPFNRRHFHKSPYIDHLRMSFGPAWPNLRLAIQGMNEFVNAARSGVLPPLDK